MGLIVTLPEYKTHAGITGTADDARLADILDEAHAALRRACNRDLTTGFEAITRTEDYATDYGELQLKEYPVSSITSITRINDDNTLGVAIPATDYRLESSIGVVTLNASQNGRVIKDADTDREVISSWQYEPRFVRVRVVYVSSAPAADVKGVIKRMTDGLYSGVRRDPSIASQSLGAWSVSYASASEAAQQNLHLIRSLRGGGVL
jgi:hypothetical protein